MTTNITKSSLFLLISIFTIVIATTTLARYPDILSDFTSPENQSSVDANYFTYTAMRGIFQKSVDKCTTTKATKAEFPVLNGQGVSLAVLQFPPGSVNPPHYHSRATGLFLLLEGVLEIFSLNKWTGKKCYFLGARDLNIVWSDTPDAWEWTCVPESRFPEVAQLKFVRWLQIWGTIRAGILSPLTSYTAYFVYKLGDDSYGFDTRHMEVSVGISGVESANVRIAFLHLNPQFIPVDMYTSPYTPPSPYIGYCWMGPGWPGIDYDPPEDVDWDHHPSNLKLDKPVPKLRDDGWFELELGNFLTENEDDCIELRMEDVKTGCTKQGLIVEGIEIRPTIA